MRFIRNGPVMLKSIVNEIHLQILFDASLISTLHPPSLELLIFEFVQGLKWQLHLEQKVQDLEEPLRSWFH